MSWWRGLDVVIGYQVSWILMFADYSRYTRSVRGSAIAVFLGSGADQRVDDAARRVAARAAGTSDPGAMLEAVGLGAVWRLPAHARDPDDELREHLHVVAGVEEPGAAGQRHRGDLVDRHRRHRA